MPWKDLVGRRRRARSSSARPAEARRSSGRRLTLRGQPELPAAPDSLTARIERRMEQLAQLDGRALKRALQELQHQLSTPGPEQRAARPLYNLMNGRSVDRKFVDDMAEQHLAEGTHPRESELLRRAGVDALRRDLTFDP